MNKFVRDITLLICAVPFICEIHSVIGWFYPNTNVITYNMWVSKSYDERISVVYYLFELENILAWVIWFYAFAKTAKLVSYKLFKILLVFVLYFITQLLLYVWNRNSSIVSNLIIYLYMSIAITFLLIPSKKKGGKLINIEDY